MFGSFATNVKTTGYELTGDLGKCLRMGGLTFYKDFTKSGNLDADFALGSRTATYTSTSGVPTIGANGYAATTANDDVLKYEIAKNRTAEQETIVIKFMPNSNFANDGVIRYLLSSDADVIHIRKGTTVATIAFRPNFTDTVSAVCTTTTTPLENVSYVVAGVAYGGTGNPNEAIFINGASESSQNTDYTVPSLGTYFYLGSSNSGAEQGNLSIAWIKIFNRALTASEILTLQ